jgi:hypothetical protein
MAYRVDVAGRQVYVNDEAEYEHLKAVNQSLAAYKLALHKIIKISPEGYDAKNIARDVLKNAT